ncbi:hypothetical protein NURINAE_01647 [Candidatus Nitrosacidococcus sp. I8]|nr:hypothetical protein NURINAE_01647 [Candidatus Nitrosacidococcus sp. I8]
MITEKTIEKNNNQSEQQGKKADNSSSDVKN